MTESNHESPTPETHERIRGSDATDPVPTGEGESTSPAMLAGAERLAFTLDDNLIDHLVHRQAAAVEKAVVELIMNAVDAGATTVSVQIDDHGFEVEDDGRGFESREVIEQYFARFGTPHVDGDATYGRFRIGRAQIMAHAATVWRTQQFQMSVDIRADARGFELKEGLETRAGCRIVGAWYPLPASSRARDVLDPSRPRTDHASIVARIREMLLYPPIDVVVNGKRIEGCTSKTWTHEDEFAYYALREHIELAIYNQGIYIKDLGSRQWHIGGVVVSKRALSLTMARNEIVHTCPEWNGIRKALLQQRDALHTGGTTKGSEAYFRYRTAQFMAGTPDFTTPFLTLVPKRQVSVADLLKLIAGSRNRLAFASYGEILKAERIARHTGVPVIHLDCLDRIEACMDRRTTDSLENVISFLQIVRSVLYENEREFWLNGTSCTSSSIADDLAETNVYRIEVLALPPDQATVIPRDALSPRDRRNLALVARPLQTLARALNVRPRRIEIGRSSESLAWTDGKRYIAFNRKFLEVSLNSGAIGLIRLAHVALHEYAHQSASLNQGHDDAFHREFHDLTMEASQSIAYLVQSIQRELEAELLAAVVPRVTTSLERAVAAASRRVSIPSTVDAIGAPRSILAGVLERVQELRRDIGRAKQGEIAIAELEEHAAEFETGVREDIQGLQPTTDTLRLPSAIRQIFRSRPPDRLPSPDFHKRLIGLEPDLAGFTMRLQGRSIRIMIEGFSSPMFAIKVGEDFNPERLKIGTPMQVRDAMSAIIERNADAFPWTERELARDIAWWALLRAQAEQLRDEHRLGARFIDLASATTRHFKRVPNAEAISAEEREIDPASLIKRISALTSSDVRDAVRANEPGRFWIAWLG